LEPASVLVRRLVAAGLQAEQRTAMNTGASPWLSLSDAANYAKRGKRFLAKEVRAGRLRAAIVGGRKELVFRCQWLDQ
jgi:hypothetical protein